MTKTLIEHKHFSKAEKHLKLSLENHVPGGMIGICGMPGAGKTFVRNKVLIELLGAPESWGEGFTPVTEVMALLDTNSTFSSKAFAARCHRAALRPDLRALFRDSSEAIEDSYLQSLRHAEQAWMSSRTAQRVPEHEYWHAFADVVLDRKIKYVLIEHAWAIGKAVKGEEPKDHLWNLMSLFDSIGCMGILNLIPEGYKLWQGRPEISERLERVFILPYDLRSKEELTEFAGMVFKIARQYELESDQVIQRQIAEIGIATATSMRPVEKLLWKAHVKAQGRGEKISFEDIASSFETTAHVSALWEQARLLATISKPATQADLLAIHQDHLGK